MKKGFWKDVPGFCDFEDIYAYVAATAPKDAVLVEVGTLFGRSALFMAEQLWMHGRTDVKFYVVDKWQEWPDVIFNPGTFYRQVCDERGSLFGAFVHYLETSGYRDYVRVIREDSATAARMFNPTELRPHFVFIDADHTYEGCLRDIEAWADRSPRILAGHDHTPGWPGVVQAVAEFFTDSNVKVIGSSWYVGKSWLD